MTKQELARAEFFIGVGSVSARDELIRDDYTLPLFPLPLILEADGTLATDARHLFERYQA